jgi:6-phosphofructokinase 1
MRIAILTGGGDVPGLNPCIKAVVNRAVDAGYEVFGIRRGWAGLLYYNPDDPDSQRECTTVLDRPAVRKIDRTGGTVLHTSRTNPSRVSPNALPEFLTPPAELSAAGTYDCTFHVLNVLEHLRVDVLVPIGGEDTLGYGAHIHREGFPVVSVPKTMDNDVPGTDYCLGFSTSLTLSVRAIHQMRSAVGSHERLGVIELFGRHSGATSLFAAYLGSADRCLIPEVPYDMQAVAGFLLEDRAANPSNYAILTVSEGAQEREGEIVQTGAADAFGHRKLGGVGLQISRQLRAMTGVNTMNQQLAYLMRSGPPDTMDLMAAFNYGNLAMDLIELGDYGHMVALREGRYTYVPADSPAQEARSVDIDAFYDVDAYRPRIKQALGKPMFLY